MRLPTILALTLTLERLFCYSNHALNKMEILNIQFYVCLVLVCDMVTPTGFEGYF